MGVYRRNDSDIYWMSLVIDGKRVRQDTGVQDRMAVIRTAKQAELPGVSLHTLRHTLELPVTPVSRDFSQIA